MAKYRQIPGCEQLSFKNIKPGLNANNSQQVQNAPQTILSDWSQDKAPHKTTQYRLF